MSVMSCPRRLPDEKQSESDLLAAGEGPPVLEHPDRIRHLPAVLGQPAVHQPRHPALREDVRGRLRQHRRAQHHQGRNKARKMELKWSGKINGEHSINIT